MGGAGKLPLQQQSDQDLQDYISMNNTQVEAVRAGSLGTVEKLAAMGYLQDRASSAQQVVDQRAQAQATLAAQAQQRQQALDAQTKEQASLASQARAAQQQSQADQADIAAQAAQQQAAIRTTGQAVSSSLRILNAGDGSEAPTSALTGGGPRGRGRARSTTASLRFGSTSQGSGAGSNIAI
jgi:hypothetical protein